MSIQTDRVVARIGEDLNHMLAASARLWAGAMRRVQPAPGSPASALAQQDLVALDARCRTEGGVIRATETGYLERIDHDTFTGIRCVDRLGDALREFAAMLPFDGAWRGAAGTVRLIEPSLKFPHVVKTAFAKIRQAAVGTPAVMIRMLETCTRLAPLMKTDEQRQALLEQAEALWEAASSAPLVRMDRRDVESAYRAARDTLVGA